MKASRATQPYRKGVARQPGLAEKAMKRGRTATGFNPSDITRGLQRGANGSRKVLQPVSPAGPAKGVAMPKLSPAMGQLKKAVANRQRASDAAAISRQATDVSAARAEAKARGAKASIGTGTEVNRTGNARSGQRFKTVAGNGGEWHVYEGGKRVFVKKPSGRQRLASKVQAARRAPAKGVSR